MLKRKFQSKKLAISKTVVLAILNILLAGVYLSDNKPAIGAPVKKTEDLRDALNCNREFNKAVLSKVDSTVRSSFYSEEMSKDVWPQALEKQREKILDAKNLIELSNAVNAAIDELKTSHCRFLTINDDTYYFLNSLFVHGKKGSHGEPIVTCAFPGFITGGAGFQDDRVRFVLDGSPAQKAGFKVADKILTVDKKKICGHVQLL